MTDQIPEDTGDARDVEINYDRNPERFTVTASLGASAIVLTNNDPDSDDDLATLVAALPQILNAVAADLQGQEVSRG